MESSRDGLPRAPVGEASIEEEDEVGEILLEQDEFRKRSAEAVGAAQARVDEHSAQLDWWVLDVLIILEPIPGMKRGNRKSAAVTLFARHPTRKGTSP